jgi:hypothetical protein
MSVEEMPQDHEQFARVLLIAATEGVMDIVAHHVAYLLCAVPRFEQVAAHGGSHNIGYVFVLRDGQDLFLREAAKSDGVLKADHTNLHVRPSPAPLIGVVALLAWTTFHAYWWVNGSVGPVFQAFKSEIKETAAH